MRIQSLRIENFRNLRLVEMGNIPDLVILAGANGCGKTAVLDAIVQAKEALGRYSHSHTPVNPAQITADADSAEIAMEVGTNDAERAIVENLQPTQSCLVKLHRSGRLEPGRSPSLSGLFSKYRDRGSPEAGVLEYYRSDRRLPVVKLREHRPEFMNEERWRETAVYPANRFDDIKQYMAGLALRDVQDDQQRIRVRRETVGPYNYTDSFGEIRSVFSGFFSPMEFNGVILGSDPFRYIISTPSGEIDLDDLSDGEKAVFTIAFDIIRRDIRNSVILIDEPELHLHPELAARLVQLLPDIRGGNQIWLATQCAEIVRTAPPDSVFRIAKIWDEEGSQARPVFSSAEMRDTLTDLVGNVGLVTLNRRIVFLEGSDPGVDTYILKRLYADRLNEIQLVPCGSVKAVTRVSDKVLSLLEEAAEYNFFYAIRDRDLMAEEDRGRLEEGGRGRLFVWDAYHVENYLLDPSVLFEAVRAVRGDAMPCASVEEVARVCREIAEGLVDTLVARQLDLYLRTSVPLPGSSVDPNRPLEHAMEVLSRIATGVSEMGPALQSLADSTRIVLNAALMNETWRQVFPGREILRRLAGRIGVPYDVFRNAAVKELGEPPAGIARVMDAILGARTGAPDLEDASSETAVSGRT